jgi:hypothetical protein
LGERELHLARPIKNDYYTHRPPFLERKNFFGVCVCGCCRAFFTCLCVTVEWKPPPHPEKEKIIILFFSFQLLSLSLRLHIIIIIFLFFSFYPLLLFDGSTDVCAASVCLMT